MKRSIRALVRTETAMVAVIVGMAVAGLCAATRAGAAAQAVSPQVELGGDASLIRGDTSSVTFHVNVAFSANPSGADPFTLQKAVMLFPDRAGTNGRLFPSCSARMIERFRGNIRRCPKGSQIGSGTVEASAIQLGIDATGRVTMFNSRRGKAITFNIQTRSPAYVNRSFDASLRRIRYGEKLALVVPETLQEIIPGVFVGVRDFDVTLAGAVRVRGVEHTYIRARTCPTRPLRGVFSFKDWTTGQTATVTADTKVRCTASRAG